MPQTVDEKIFKETFKNAKRGDSCAQRDLGFMYEKGRGVVKDEAEACAWYRRAASQGHADAKFKLGDMYANGRGVQRDAAKACQLYEQAAQKGHASAQHNLGVMYAEGLGVEQNAVKACKWFDKAVRQDHIGAFKRCLFLATEGLAVAQFILGHCYEDGLGAPQNYDEAFEWYKKAADQDLPRAQNKLGHCYEDGLGVLQNDDKALEWYKKAAKKGYANAQNNLGNMYANNSEVNKDEEEACKWYRKAAEQGFARAQFNLGLMYEQGRGVNKDEAMALFWVKKSYLQGQGNRAKSYLEDSLLIPNNGFFKKFVTQGKEIGRGGCGIVYKGQYKGQDVAIKQLKFDSEWVQENMEEFSHELLIMAALEHPSLVTLCGYTKLPLQLIVECCHKGSLDVFLRSIRKSELPWELRFKMARQLAEGLAYLHKNNVVHQDIKSLNVLVDSNFNVKWADFGLSTIKKNTGTVTVLGKTDPRKIPSGTIPWMAPEQVKGQTQCSRRADVYSLGVVMWELASHQYPYDIESNALSMFQLIFFIANGVTNPIPEGTPVRFSNAIKQCWFSPGDRPTARQLSNYLADGKDGSLELQTNNNNNNNNN